MVRVTEELALSPEAVTLYYASDPLLGHLPVLAFHGPSTTANFTHNSSRIQVHIYSPAGFQSFPRLTISPNSPFYSVVHQLPREFQGDEICRGLAFALYKYFSDLSDAVKTYLRNQYPTTRGRRPGSAPALFGEQHAADLAKAMARADDNMTPELIRVLESALQTQHVSNLDLDFVLPPGSVSALRPEDLENNLDDIDDDDVLLDPTLRQYDPTYLPLVKLFGEPVFLPTSKLRRAPSRPSSLSHRSKSFSKDQKVGLRMQMGELVDTEERYVLKLNELVKHIADDFRQHQVKQREVASSTDRNTNPEDPENYRNSSNENLDGLEGLFPRCADRILQVNSAFMQDLRRVMDDTEEDAVRDLDVPYTFGSSSSRTTMLSVNTPGGAGGGGGSTRVKDPSGALAMAKTFLEWFPKFTDCYQDYIRASQHFPQLLNGLMDGQSSFRDRILQSTGEQALRSILIEPVQRLPRYSLFIDQIVGCLPITHPALQLMLRARDIITNICSMDDPLQDKPQVTNRLRNMVECWPVDLEPQGRLVMATDFVELAAPFDADTLTVAGGMQEHRAGLFLLFSDCLVMVKKKAGSTLTGRDMLREIDKPSPAGLLASMTNAAGGPGTYDFAFSGWHQLADVRFTESADGRLVWMTSTQEMRGAHAGGEYVSSSKAITSRCFVLQEASEGKAVRWSEDIVKARIEGRFSEAERENSPVWTLRSARMLPEMAGAHHNMGLHAAVFPEAAEELVEGRREPAAVRVVLDNHKGTKGAPVGHYGVEIVVEVRTDVVARTSSSSRGSYGDSNDNGRRLVMNTVGLNGKRYTDDIAIEDFLPTLSRRIIQLTSVQFNTNNPKLVPGLVSYHTKTLRSLNFNTRSEKTRSFLASSPVKLLSSFLGGNASSTSLTESPYSPTKQQRPLSGSLSRSPANVSSTSLVRQASNAEVASLSGSIRERDPGGRLGVDSRPVNPLVRLEQTFTGYVAALQARKGQFIGRTLLNRGSSTADELAINQLYNKLNESPHDWDSSADLTPEVVFAAFEKFTHIAWKDQMGTIMTIQSLDALQERAARKVPGDFADFVNYLFTDMAPQNRRAFTALIKLLADLLDGCSNDGDRGALTLAFAELLVADSGSAHNYINLLDRLVVDCDRIFDEIGFSASGGNSGSTSGYGSISGGSVSAQHLRVSPYESFNSTGRSQKSATGSVTSNTSSLRRKFGLESLLRQNSASSSIRAGGTSALEAMVGTGSGSGAGSGGGAGGYSNSSITASSSELERTSMWRQLSKHHRHPATGESSSLSKATSAALLGRSRSIDMGPVINGQSPSGAATMNKLIRRPASKDRPPVAGAFEDIYRPPSSHRPVSSHRPTSSHQLETIGEPDYAKEVPSTPAPGEKKKKRRSSLSDLKSLMAAASLEDAPSTPRTTSNSNASTTSTNKNSNNPLPPVPLRTTKPTSEKFNSSPRATSPSKIPISPQSAHLQQQQQNQQSSPQHATQNIQSMLDVYPAKPQQKENIAEGGGHVSPTRKTSSPIKVHSSPKQLSPSKLPASSSPPKQANSLMSSSPGKLRLPGTPTATPKRSHGTHHSPSASLGTLGDLTSTPKLGHAKTLSTGSGIPTLRTSRGAGTVLSPPGASAATQESPTRSPTRHFHAQSSSPSKSSSSMLPSATSTSGSTSTTGQKLRLQSPQKLRERLQTEKKAVEEVDDSLKSELSRISEDMARLSSGPTGTTASSSSTHHTTSSTELRKLSAAVKSLESRLPQATQALADKQAALQQNMDEAVSAAEAKVRAIDQMYREATAENELLYEKFNVELGKIVKALKGKGRDDKEELIAKLKEQSEETARVKKENARLRREAVSLRTLLKGGNAA